MNTWVVIPAYNEEHSIGSVLEGLKREGYEQIIVVDDGSQDKTPEIAKAKDVKVISHKNNQGLGAALRTGLQEAYEQDAEIAVTFDADGQHDPKAIPGLINALNGADLAVGVRDRGEMPWNKRVGNSILDVITRLLGGPLIDSQSGFRAFNQRALKKIQIQTNRYAVSSEIMIQSQEKNLKVKGVPIRGIFTDYSMMRGTNIASGVRIFLSLLKYKVS